jgi:methylthioribose-1-phosphate isomerase
MELSSGFRTIAFRDGQLTLIDQTRLPRETIYVNLNTLEDVAQSIETMVVRGAPAIGITAAFGIVIAAKQNLNLQESHDRLARTRPTAVNLFWALNRMKKIWSTDGDFRALEAEAHAIYREDVEACRKIGEHGANLIQDGDAILTHCNAGALATSEYGTALSVIRFAVAAGKRIKVFAGETRPVLQGARLTAWELMQDGIDVTVIPDNAVAHLMSQDLIDCSVVGADRIAANGDAANKIGTRQIAAIFQLHEKPFFVAAPWSTVDMEIHDGSQIPIEERPASEVTHIGSVQITPDGVSVRNPAFDVTPANWISSVITELGSTGKNIAGGLRAQANHKRIGGNHE